MFDGLFGAAGYIAVFIPFHCCDLSVTGNFSTQKRRISELSGECESEKLEVTHVPGGWMNRADNHG